MEDKNKPAAQPQAEFDYNGWSIDHSAGRPILMHNSCSVIEAEQAYGLLKLIKTAAQPKVEPVARVEIGADRNAALTITDDNWLRSLKDRGAHQLVPLYAEQSAPVAVSRSHCVHGGVVGRCLWCKDQSKLVLPSRRSISESSREQAMCASSWNACLDELKRLNPKL